MPQMSPINWTIMFILFILTLLALITNIYFTSYLSHTSSYLKSFPVMPLKHSMHTHEWSW